MLTIKDMTGMKCFEDSSMKPKQFLEVVLNGASNGTELLNIAEVFYNSQKLSKEEIEALLLIISAENMDNETITALIFSATHDIFDKGCYVCNKNGGMAYYEVEEDALMAVMEKDSKIFSAKMMKQFKERMKFNFPKVYS